MTPPVRLIIEIPDPDDESTPADYAAWVAEELGLDDDQVAVAVQVGWFNHRFPGGDQCHDGFGSDGCGCFADPNDCGCIPVYRAGNG